MGKISFTVAGKPFVMLVEVLLRLRLVKFYPFSIPDCLMTCFIGLFWGDVAVQV